MNEFTLSDQVSSIGPHTSSVSSEAPSGSHSPQRLSSASSYADLNYLFGVQDTKSIPPKPNRNRRKSSQASDHAKHRRTRSGCYTCRSRRVKCDEAHPICERCKKGGRECVYPEPSSTSSNNALRSKNKSRESPGSSDDENDAEREPEKLEAIPDEDEDPEDSASVVKREAIRLPASTTSGEKISTRQNSETPSLVQDKGASPTPSTEGSVGYSTYASLANPQNSNISTSAASGVEELRSDWSHLPPDLQYYMSYFFDNVTYLHYSLKYDAGNFLRTQFLDAALRNDALLHAAVGFSAFQRTLHNPQGRIEDFLPYYNKAVSLLLLSLKRGERHNLGTILAILQLATIEEFLGDWINLLGHQKAAYEILTEMFTPETIMQTEMTRTVLAWYMRFDVFAGLLGGFQTVLSRDWFSYAHEFFRQQVIKEPDILSWRVENALSQYRLLAMDMSLLFARMGKGEITRDQFVVENDVISQKIEDWKTKMDPALQDRRYLVTEFTDARPLDLDDIVDPYQKDTLYTGPLWVMNIANIDWISIDIMHKYQTALTLGLQPAAELVTKAYASCQLFEAVQYFSGSPPGTLIACQASLGIACLFLPRDSRHAMWARHKLAAIEAMGYIYPYTFRTKMADLFRDRSCMHWWLPNEEGYPQIVRSIRKFVEERTSQPKDMPSEDLRDMKAVFSSLKLDDGKSTQPSSMESGKEAVLAQDWTSAGVRPDNSMADMGLGDESYGFDERQGFWEEADNGFGQQSSQF